MNIWKLQVALAVLKNECRGAAAFVYKNGFFRQELLITKRHRKEKGLENVLLKKDHREKVLQSAGEMLDRF